MSNKRLYIVLGIMFISLTINGCSQSNDNSSVVSAFSDSVIGIEVQEPVDSLNEGQAIDREDGTEENKIDADGSAIGTDGKTNEELEQELNGIEDQKVEDTSNFSGGAVDYSNEPWYVEGIDYSRDNNGQGWDLGGKHYNTKGEYLKAMHEMDSADPDNLTPEEIEILGNGGTIMK